MKTIFLLVGEMGCGKSHWGRILSKYMNMPFVEGDDHLTPEMHKRTSRFKSVSRQIVQEYVTKLQEVILGEARQSDHGIVVAQALYNDQDRTQLIQALEQQGYQVECYWVKAGWINNLRNLWRRPNKIRWTVYWLLNKPWFQRPTHAHQIWRN